MKLANPGSLGKVAVKMEREIFVNCCIYVLQSMILLFTLFLCVTVFAGISMHFYWDLRFVEICCGNINDYAFIVLSSKCISYSIKSGAFIFSAQ